MEISIGTIWIQPERVSVHVDAMAHLSLTV
jgi:hypothetical protein